MPQALRRRPRLHKVLLPVFASQNKPPTPSTSPTHTDTMPPRKLPKKSSSPPIDSTKPGQDQKHTMDSHSLIQVSESMLFLATGPFWILAYLCWRMGLVDISTSLLTGCARTSLQLGLLGTILRPIFQFGKVWLVVGYATFMMILAAYEASSRTKYIFEGQIACILVSLAINVGWVSLFAFAILIRPKPVWNPRYVIPIVGMLLGNSINGISLSLDAITKGMVEQDSEIQLYLSFGATKWEAMARLLGEAIQVGVTPILNTMRVIGIISIPGMMTGQILGGSSAMTAAKYQMLIIFLIGMATVSVVLMNAFLAVEAGFDAQHDVLRTDRFALSDRLRVSGMIAWAWTTAGNYVTGSLDESARKSGPSSPKVVLDQMEASNVLKNTVGSFEIRSFHIPPSKSESVADPWLLEVQGLGRSFPIRPLHETTNQKVARRVLFRDVSLSVGVGDLVLIGGPSGAGKSTLLQMMAGLSPLDDPAANTDMKLGSKSWRGEYVGGRSSALWRQNVRYVTQSKVAIPGTPQDFLERITSFASWNSMKTQETALLSSFAVHVERYLNEWGLTSDALNKEWSQLSGGEAQRVILAIALASRPSVLLLDESTSALDTGSKMAVETSVKDYVATQKRGVCWISHDTQQTDRMTTLDLS